MTITATKPFCDGIVPDNLAKYCKRFLDPCKGAIFSHWIHRGYNTIMTSHDVSLGIKQGPSSLGELR